MSRQTEMARPAIERSALRSMLPRLVLGTGLAAIGVLFTLDNLDVLEARHFLRYWPALLVLFGIGLLVSGTARSERIGGVVWTLVGGWLLADRIVELPFSLFDMWPLALVIVGALLVMRALRPRRAAEQSQGDSVLHAFAMMSGVRRSSSSLQFQGGSLTAIMGGIEIDLRSALLAGGTATIDTFAMWGGVEVRVPPGWVIDGRVWPLMGGFEDKTTPPTPDDVAGTLVVTGWAIMGGVEVKN
jgi:predicted membrane protein